MAKEPDQDVPEQQAEPGEGSEPARETVQGASKFDLVCMLNPGDLNMLKIDS